MCIALAAVSATLSASITQAGAAGVAKPPRQVARVVSTPGVGVITVSWRQDAGTGITYTVDSVPTGSGCTVVDADSCTVPATTSTPWRFTVTASDAVGKSPRSAPTRVVRHRYLLVVAGQSNALGATSYAVDPTTGVNYFGHPYSNAADTKSSITWAGWLQLAPPATPGDVVPLDTPQILQNTTTQTFGPEIGLARQLWSDTAQAVTIVKIAVSDTSITVWNPATPDGLFDDMLYMVDATMATDAARGQLDTIGGIYWYQGETDVLDPSLYPAYQTNLTAFIGALRSELPVNASAPIVLVKESLAAAIANQQNTGACTPQVCATLTAGDTAVRAADDWAAANLPDVLTVDSLGLPRTAASALIHLSDVGELELGEELAQASEHRFP